MTAPPMPPNGMLEHVLEALCAWLPGHFDALLEAQRFADGRDVLRRLAAPGGAAAAAAWLEPAEAGRLTDLLLARWAALGPVEVPPLAMIVGPDEADPPATHHTYRIATYGVDEGWTARWSGPVTPTPDGRSAVLEPQARTGEGCGTDAAAPARIGAQVFASTSSGRVILSARPIDAVTSQGAPP